MARIVQAFVLGAVLAVGLTAVAWANASDDGNAGLDALNNGAYDEAIRLFSHALKSGELSGDDKEFAYLNRGKAYLGKGDGRNALIDANRAVALNADDGDAIEFLKQSLTSITNTLENGEAGTASTGPKSAPLHIRAAIGMPLQAATNLATTGDENGARQKLKEAKSVAALTPDEKMAIAQTKAFVDAKTGSGAPSLKNKFVADYNAGRYRDAIADADSLRRTQGLDAMSALVVAQSYYLLADYVGARNAAQSEAEKELSAGTEPSLSLERLLAICNLKLAAAPSAGHE